MRDELVHAVQHCVFDIMAQPMCQDIAQGCGIRGCGSSQRPDVRMSGAACLEAFALETCD